MNNNFKEDYKYNDPEIKELMNELHYIPQAKLYIQYKSLNIT